VEARAADNGDWTVRGDDEHPANRGRLCVKGTALAETLGLEDRLLYPEIHGRRVGWDQALDTVALGFSRIIEAHGPEAVAFYLSGQLLTEDYYVANKLMKGFIGSANVDTNSRLCMSTAVAAHQRAFGADLVPGCYDDLELADLVLLVGSNLAWTHPVVFQRLAAAKQARPDMKVVVVDPRRSATCELADLHLALRPGSDGHLFVGLLSELAQRGRIDAEYIGSHTTGFAGALAAALASVPDAAAIAVACDLNTDAVARFCAWFAATERTVTLFSQGINQSSSGVDKANAIINCHLATGRIGRPGAAPFSITGQPNAMGGREVGGLANQLAAHMVFESAADRDRVARFWKAPRLAGCAGLKAVPLFDAVAAGRVKAIWIMATNPVVSLPDADRVRAALAGCELVVVSDCVRNTDTTALADVLLPALTWGEKDGTVTNSERMISRQRAFLKPPGEARPDWKIVTALARRLGYGEAFPYRHPAEIFREHAALTAFENDGSRTLDLGALARLKPHAYEALEPVQWPVPIDRPQGTPRLFADARFATPDGRARLLSVAPQFPPEEPGIGRTMMLNTGRVRDQWHTMTRTAKSARLLQHTPEPYAEIHPEDAGALGVKEHELLRLQARGAQLVARVRCSPQPRRGSVFVPMHWNLRYAAKARVGPLIAPVLDPISGQPALKHAQVTAARFPTRWQGMLLTRAPVAPPVVGYWCRVPQADHELWYLADDETLSNPAALARTVLGKAGAWLELEDESAGIYRCAQIVDGRLEGVLMLSTGPGLPSTEWLATLFSAREVSLTDRRRLLAASPGAAGPDPGPIVCCCHRVHLDPIVAAVTRGLETTKALGAALRCGTQCGSCLPELQQLITEHRRARVA
jgi:assimilatory nitrate reductase catalytic subunit